MNTVKKIAKNTIFLFIAEIISKVSLFLLIVFIARKLGDVALGKYAFAISFGFFFTILANFGLDILIKRNVARKKELVGKYINNVSAIKFFFSLIAFILLVVIINLLKYSSDTKLLVYMFGASLILNAFANAFRAIFYAFEQMQYEAFLRVLEKILILIFSLSFIFFGYGLFHVSLVFLIVSVTNVLVSILIVYKKYTPVIFEFDIEFWKFLLKNSWPFAVSSILGVIYFRIDIVMLSFLKGDAVVGWYSAAFQIIEGLSFIQIIFMSAVFPVMSKFFISDKTGLNISIEKSFKYLLIIVLPISIGIFLLSERFIFLIFGNGFYNSIIALKILIVSLIIMFIVRPFGYALYAIDKQRIVFIVTLIMTILNIVLNLMLIPIFSYIGAAISTLVSEIILLFLFYHYVAKYCYKVPLIKNIYKPLLAVLIMGIFVFIFNEINLLLLIVSAAVIYSLSIVLLKTFDKEDLRMFKEIIK